MHVIQQFNTFFGILHKIAPPPPPKKKGVLRVLHLYVWKVEGVNFSFKHLSGTYVYNRHD